MLPSSPGKHNHHHHGNVSFINQSTVFLGGSCNPTTWRKDIAIPMLKALNITYYDPQKDHWEPELIELEDKAKKNSQVLFFVIDNQTRSIASMIEVSFIAATTKKLVLVIDLFPSLEPIINGEPISQYEHDILKGGRKLLMKLVERKGMPVFNQIPAALNYIPIMISRNQSTTISDCDNNVVGVGVSDGGCQPMGPKRSSKNGQDDVTLTAHQILTTLLSPYELTKVKEVYDSCADMYTGCLSLLDTKLAYLMLTGHDLDDNLMNQLINLTISSTSSSTLTATTTTATTATTTTATPTPVPTTTTINHNGATINTSDNITKENYSPNNQFNSINNLNHQLNHSHVNHHHHHHQQHQHHHPQQQQSPSSSSSPTLITTANLITSTINQKQSIVDSNHSNHHHHLNHNYLNQHLNHHHLNNNQHHHLYHPHDHLNYNNNNMETSLITINFKQFCSLIVDYLQSNNLLSKSISSTQGSSHFVNINPPSTPPPPPSLALPSPQPQPQPQPLQQQQPPSPTVNFLTSLVNLPQLDVNCDNLDERKSQQQFKDSLNNNLIDSQRMKTVDIYLGGSDNPKGWRSSIAIPLIDQSKLTYSMPNINSTINCWDKTGNDLTKLESCQVLLFVIGGQQPELETMILATHYFGQKFKVVLCVQPIPIESVAQDNQISMAAIDDYNRGRAYLSEIARKENIQVFEDLEESVKCAIKSVKSSS